MDQPFKSHFSVFYSLVGFTDMRPVDTKDRCWGLVSQVQLLKVWMPMWGSNPLLLREQLWVLCSLWLWVTEPGVGFFTRSIQKKRTRRWVQDLGWLFPQRGLCWFQKMQLRGREGEENFWQTCRAKKITLKSSMPAKQEDSGKSFRIQGGTLNSRIDTLLRNIPALALQIISSLEIQWRLFWIATYSWEGNANPLRKKITSL